MLSLLYGPSLTSVHDNWKNHRFDYIELSLQSDVSAFQYAIWVCHSFSSKERVSINFMAAVTITMILEPKKIKCVITSIFPPPICHEEMRPDAMILVFWMWSFRMAFSLSPSPSSRGSLVPLCFLPLERYHLHIWGCWYFSQQSWFQLMIHPAQHFARYTLYVR